MKKVLSILLASATLLSVTACGKSDGGEASSTAATTDAASSKASSSSEAAGTKSKLTVTFRDDGIGEAGSGWRWFKSAADSYENKDVEVDIAPITASEGDYFAKIALQLKSGETAPDIVMEDTFQVANDVSAGYLTDLTTYLKDYPEWTDGSYYESLKEGTTIDGKTYGIPYNTDTRGLWYNKEIFKQAGLSEDWVPKDWNEIITTLKTIKEKCPDIVPFWCNSGVATGEATSMQTYEMLLYATGERLIDEDSGKWITKSDGILKSLEFIQTIYKEELGPPLSKVLNGQAGNTSSREYLPQGKLAVSLDGSWITSNYLDTGASPWDKYADTLGFTTFPTNEGQDPKTMTLAGGWGLSIPEKSDNKDVAFDFIKHCMDPAIYTPAVIEMGSITSRTDVAASEEYSSIPFMKTATDFLASAQFRPKDDKYSSVSTCIQTMVESVASGTAPADAMATYAIDVARTVGDDNVIEK